MIDEINHIVATPFSLAEWDKRWTEETAFQATLEPSDPRHNKMFRLDHDLKYLDVYWGGYEYSFEFGRLDTPAKLLAFLEHVLAKNWEYATARRAALLVRTMNAHFGWGMHQAEWEKVEDLKPRTTTAAAERAKLTPKLRYDVLLRDDFRCRSCGFAVESGAHLHIDHVKPVSAGGETIFNNLQALCSVCNQGKGARR